MRRILLRVQEIRSPIVAALFVIVVVASSGCTARQSKDEYQDRLARAVAVRTDVSAAMQNHTLRTEADYDVAAKRASDALDELDADAPPRSVSKGHDQMVSGLDGLSTLLTRLGRCEGLAKTSQQDARACRESISQGVYDEIKNDFSEADTIYRAEGLSLPGLGGENGGDGTIDRGDVLDEPSGDGQK